MKISKIYVVITLGMISGAFGDPGAGPGPSPAADPGRNKAKGVKPVITRNPTSIIAVRGKLERFECAAEGYPSPAISWLKDGSPLKTDEKIFQMPTGEVMFYNVRSTDEGTYVCVARNSAGVVRSRNATLQIAYIKEDFRTIPEDKVAAIGGTATLRCQGPRGLPEPRISWKKDGKDLNLDGDRKKVVDGDLVISRATKTDSGPYKCIAKNKAGTRESITVLLSVHAPPVFTVRPEDKTVSVGGELELACEARGDPKPRIKWSKPMGVQNSRVESLTNGNLRISNVQPGDEGEYVCRAENVVKEITATVTVTVNRGPYFVRHPSDTTARVGSTVTIPCWADGKPKPNILWRALDGSNIFPGNVFKDARISVKPNGDLTIQNVRFSDQGKYVCEVHNPTGHITANAQLVVMSRESNINPPVLRQVPSNMTVAREDNVELKCSSSAVPVPVFRWTKEGSGDIITGARFLITSSGSLRISDVESGDAGTYKCTASNEFGWSEWNASIKVVAKGSQSPVVDPSNIPGSPTALVLVNSTTTTMTVKWSTNSEIGGPLASGYYLEYYCLQGRRSSWERVDGVISSSMYTVKGLNVASKYVFLVRARNNYGISDPSEVSEIFSTLGAAVVPGNDPNELSQVVVRVTSATPLPAATSGGSPGIQLHWTSSANCDFIDGFKIYLQPVSKPKGAQRVETVRCFAGTTDLVNLQALVVYEIRIHPYKAEGIGRPSPIFLASPESGGANPQPPTLSVDPKPIGDDAFGSAVFTWGGPRSILPDYITRYTFRCKDKMNSANYDVTEYVNSSVTSITLKDLPSGREYDAFVTFSTRLGDGVASKRVEFSIQASAPTPAPPDGGLSDIMSNPGVLAGIAACLVVVILIIVGVIMYRKHKRNKKGRGLHGRGSIPLDPFSGAQYSKGFTMSLTNPGNVNFSDGTGSSAGNPSGNSIFMQSGGRAAPSSVARNTTVSLNNCNGNVGTTLSPEMRPAGRQAGPFSYVTDQLTSMSSIPPQFSSPNLERNPAQSSDFQLQLQEQQQQYHRQISDNPTVVADEISPQMDLIDMVTPTNDPRNEFYHKENDLPPPPPSPPMSQKTSLSDRTNRSRGSSRNSAERGSNHSSKGRRSRERNRGFQAMERVATDTDTGIDSPQQTPSPPRPSDLRGEHPSSQQRGRAGYPYGSKQHSGRRRHDGSSVEYPRSGDPNLGYLAGPSEGETESEVGGVRHVRPAYIPHPEEVRNSVAASSVSMMNRYDSESSDRSSSPASSIESLNMESASQVGVNDPQNMMQQRSANSAFLPIQTQSQYLGGGTPNRPSYAKPKVPKRQYKDQPGIVDGHYNSNHPHLAAPEQFINRINSASSSGSSSYHQNTADSGMSAGHGSYGHNSLNSSSSVESGSKGQMSRSRTTGSLSADNNPNQVESGQQFASVDRRPPDNSEYQQQRGRFQVNQPRKNQRPANGSKSPQRKTSQDSNLSLPPRDGSAYVDYETSNPSDRQPMLQDHGYREHDSDSIPEESRPAAAKSVFARGRHPNLSDLPEISTSDFCEDYSDRSQ